MRLCLMVPCAETKPLKSFLWVAMEGGGETGMSPNINYTFVHFRLMLA